MTEPTHLSAEELEIRERANAASPAPFDFCVFPHHSGRDIQSNTDVAETVAFSAMQSNKAELWGVALPEKDDSGLNVVVAYTGNGPNSANNANFLAHARTDVPKLLDSLEAARRELAERTTEANRMRTTLIACRMKFLDYVDLHEAKGNMDKAKGNQRMADLCTTALATAPPSEHSEGKQEP